MRFEVDDRVLIDTIVERVVERLKPMLKHDSKADDRLMDVKTLADYLQVKQSWIYDKIHRKELPFWKIGKFPRFRKKDIDIWLRNPYSSELDNYNLNNIK